MAQHVSVYETDDACISNAPATRSLSGYETDLFGISVSYAQFLERHMCCFIMKTLGSGKSAESYALS